MLDLHSGDWDAPVLLPDQIFSNATFYFYISCIAVIDGLSWLGTICDPQVCPI